MGELLTFCITKVTLTQRHSAVNLIVAADDLTKGRLVESDRVLAQTSEDGLQLTDDQLQTVKDGEYPL